MKKLHHRCLLMALLGMTPLAACGEFDPLNTEIAGTVHGESYLFVSGTAEASMGSFVLTLADDPDYDCLTTPAGTYLTIVVSGVDQRGNFPASGNVSFNIFEDGINRTEAATSGTVVIDTFDPDGQRRIEGELDAIGDESDVFGTFSVPVC